MGDFADTQSGYAAFRGYPADVCRKGDTLFAARWIGSLPSVLWALYLSPERLYPAIAGSAYNLCSRNGGFGVRSLKGRKVDAGIVSVRAYIGYMGVDCCNPAVGASGNAAIMGGRIKRRYSWYIR